AAGPRLGEKWLHDNFPGDSDAVTNRVLARSQELLGYASVQTALLERKDALASCSCSVRLQPLVDQAGWRAQAAFVSLRRELESQLGPIQSEALVLTRDTARDLDNALLHIFSSAPSDAGSLNSELATVRRILHFQP